MPFTLLQIDMTDVMQSNVNGDVLLIGLKQSAAARFGGDRYNSSYTLGLYKHGHDMIELARGNTCLDVAMI